MEPTRHSYRSPRECPRPRLWTVARCWWRRLGLAGLAFGGLLLLIPTGRSSEQNGPKEQQVKAAFIYNFAKFVDWPADRFPTTNAPLVVGVLSRSPISLALEEVLRDRSINGHPLALRIVTTADAAKDAHILVFTPADDERLGQIMPAAASAGGGILTVGESDHFGQEGGMIRFLIEGDKVRFAIDMQAAEAARLRISAQLQKLAKFVRRKN